MVGKACEWLGSGAHSTKRLQMELAFFFFFKYFNFLVTVFVYLHFHCSRIHGLLICFEPA